MAHRRIFVIAGLPLQNAGRLSPIAVSSVVCQEHYLVRFGKLVKHLERRLQPALIEIHKRIIQQDRQPPLARNLLDGCKPEREMKLVRNTLAQLFQIQ